VGWERAIGVAACKVNIPRGAFPKSYILQKNFVFAHQNRLNKFLKVVTLF